MQRCVAGTRDTRAWGTTGGRPSVQRPRRTERGVIPRCLSPTLEGRSGTAVCRGQCFSGRAKPRAGSDRAVRAQATDPATTPTSARFDGSSDRSASPSASLCRPQDLIDQLHGTNNTELRQTSSSGDVDGVAVPVGPTAGEADLVSVRDRAVHRPDEACERAEGRRRESNGQAAHGWLGLGDRRDVERVPRADTRGWRRMHDPPVGWDDDGQATVASAVPGDGGR